MRLRNLTLLLVFEFSSGLSYAGALVGDWWQEDPSNVSSMAKTAITQPVSRSTEEIQVTLGITGTGSTMPVDFFLVISDKYADDSCSYSVDEVIIDSIVFPVSSPRHHSDINGIKAATSEAQKRLWQAFVEGRELSLKIDQICSGSEQTANIANKFDFSLKGSSAAYRYVAGLKPPELRKEPKASVPTGAPESEDTDLKPKAGPETGIPFPLVVLSIVLIFLVLHFTRRRRTASRDREAWRSSEWSEPHIGEGLRRKTATSSTNEGIRSTNAAGERSEYADMPSAAVRPDVASLPRYKVEHVIDGDTVVLSNPRREIRVRLDSIDCPEDGQDWGNIATAGLIKLIGGRHVHLEEHGSDRYERMLATLYVRNDSGIDWMNVNERMVTLGHAWVMRRYYKHLPKQRRTKLNQLERWAKSKKVGLWNTPNPVPPWNWRNNAT